MSAAPATFLMSALYRLLCKFNHDSLITKCLLFFVPLSLFPMLLSQKEMPQGFELLAAAKCGLERTLTLLIWTFTVHGLGGEAPGWRCTSISAHNDR